MICLDTNLLVYAHRKGAPKHEAAQRTIEEAARAPGGCGIAWPSICEFWSVVTHPSCRGGATAPPVAAEFIAALAADGLVAVWLPDPGFAPRLLQAATDLQLSGPRIFDLQIALIATDNGAHEIWTHDANFVAVPGLRVVDPFA